MDSAGLGLFVPVKVQDGSCAWDVGKQQVMAELLEGLVLRYFKEEKTETLTVLPKDQLLQLSPKT